MLKQKYFLGVSEVIPSQFSSMGGTTLGTEGLDIFPKCLVLVPKCFDCHMGLGGRKFRSALVGWGEGIGRLLILPPAFVKEGWD